MNHAEFETNALSEVYFRNSFVRFLSENKDPNKNSKIEEDTEVILQISREKLGEHPETAASLLCAGIFQGRERKMDEAEQKLTEALKRFKKCLGKHFMTAQSLKDIADLYFSWPQSDTEFDKSLAHYAEATEMLENLGMIESKQSILTLKNFGRRHMKMGNINEAMALLTKADKVAEKELEADHKWKVRIKTSLAALYDKVGKIDQAKAVLREGLSMGKRLNLEMLEMGNKEDIREFRNRYPEMFPESKFLSK